MQSSLHTAGSERSEEAHVEEKTELFSVMTASISTADSEMNGDTAPSSCQTASPVLTLEQLDAFVHRHAHLCENLFLFSVSPSLSASYAAHGTVFARASPESAEASPAHVTRDSRHRHSSRAFRATHAVVNDIRAMLDRVAQESHVLGALTDKQRHRLVTDVCRIGYAVGLHSRCCALFIDTMLLTPGRAVGQSSQIDDNTVARAAPQASSSVLASAESTAIHEAPSVASSSPSVVAAAPLSHSTAATKASWSAALEAPAAAIPDFVVDAAGETADLPTLSHCLTFAARMMQRDTATAASGAAAPPEMHAGWLLALHVFVQCVRVVLQHGWHGDASSTTARAKRQRELSSNATRSTTTSVADQGGIAHRAVAPVSSLNTLDTAAGEAPALDHEQAMEEACWHDFTMRVLRLLHVEDDGEAFFSATLRSARYHYTDAGGDWPAAQAAVYACCFRRWLGEEGPSRKKEATMGLVEGAETMESADLSPRTSKSGSVLPPSVPRLTCPALLVLLRTAVAARQHDIAEWATLYVDLCLDVWISEERGNGSLSKTSTPSSQAVAATPATAQLDQLLVWYLRYLQQSNQRRRACQWLRRLRARLPASPMLAAALQTLPLLRSAARLAGEALDAELALWCLQLCLGDAPTSLPLSPSQRDVFTCLCAFARCGLPTFDMVLQSLRDNDLLRPTAEELLYVRLLHARRSVHWRRECEQCLSPYVVAPTPAAAQEATVTLRLFAPLASSSEADHATGTATGAAAAAEAEAKSLSRSHTVEAGKDNADAEETNHPLLASHHGTTPSNTTVFSTRVIHQVLLLLQEGEHPSFMAYYRTFLLTFSEHVTVNDRARWAVLALTWASLQHGRASSNDVVYVVREAEQLLALQAAHSFEDKACKGTCKSSAVRAAASPPRPPPIAADLHRSLERRWAALYQHYPPSWWVSVSSGDAALLDPAVVRRMAALARSSATASIPAFARFGKKRRCLPTAEVAASEMLLVSSQASSSSSHLLDVRSDNETLHRLDCERWAAYVASVNVI